VGGAALVSTGPVRRLLVGDARCFCGDHRRDARLRSSHPPRLVAVGRCLPAGREVVPGFGR